MTATMTKREERQDQVRQRFELETADHRMTILRDDGLYRHLRFRSTLSAWAYHYDLITWPGHLAIAGDCGDFMFARIRDMFQFFDVEQHGRARFDHRYWINPGYWSEKLQAPKPGAVRVYSAEVFEARVHEWLADALTEVDSEEEKESLRAAVREQILLDDWGELHDEWSARARLSDFEHEGRRIYDPSEWDLREYDWQFLWCCWAIVQGIAQYRWVKGWRPELVPASEQEARDAA